MGSEGQDWERECGVKEGSFQNSVDVFIMSLLPGISQIRTLWSSCKDCGGAGICQHNRGRSDCKDCGGTSICQHNRQRSICKDCGGTSICQHNRKTARLW